MDCIPDILEIYKQIGATGLSSQNASPVVLEDSLLAMVLSAPFD